MVTQVGWRGRRACLNNIHPLLLGIALRFLRFRIYCLLITFSLRYTGSMCSIVIYLDLMVIRWRKEKKQTKLEYFDLFHTWYHVVIISFLHSLIKTFEKYSQWQIRQKSRFKDCNHRKGNYGHMIARIAEVNLPPQNDTEQSIQLTEAHWRHRAACASTLFFFSISPHPSQLKNTIVIIRILVLGWTGFVLFFMLLK